MSWMRSDADWNNFLRLLSPKTGERILDVGAGSGKVADRLIASGAKVYAVEPNEKLVSAMKEKFPRLEGFVGEAVSLPFPDSFFDKIYSTMVLHHIPDLDGALGEISRVLRPGGSLLLLDADPGRGGGRFLRFFENVVLRRSHRFLTRAELENLLRSSGRFDITESLATSSGYMLGCSRRLPVLPRDG